MILTVSDGNKCALRPVSGILAQLDERLTTSHGTTRRMSHREAHPGTDDWRMLSRRSSFPNGARWWSMASTVVGSMSGEGSRMWCPDSRVHKRLVYRLRDVSACGSGSMAGNVRMYRDYDESLNAHGGSGISGRSAGEEMCTYVHYCTNLRWAQTSQPRG